MAVLFSLNDASFFLSIPAHGMQQAERSVAALETLDGGGARDLGGRDGGTRFQIQTDLDDGGLAALMAAVEAGIPLGLSSGAHSRAVMVARLRSLRLPDRRNGVTLDCVVARRI